MLFYADKEVHAELDQSMAAMDAHLFPFNMETEGSKIIHIES